MDDTGTVPGIRHRSAMPDALAPGGLFGRNLASTRPRSVLMNLGECPVHHDGAEIEGRSRDRKDVVVRLSRLWAMPDAVIGPSPTRDRYTRAVRSPG